MDAAAKAVGSLPFQPCQMVSGYNNSFRGDAGPLIAHRGSLYDLPLLLEERHELGSDMMSLPGFAEPEIIGTQENMLNRGDYFYPAENLGGWEAMRRGVDATHRQGGHVLLYVEGLIVWKRSRIGRSKASDWALMDPDSKFTENYRGFYDMCPAEAGWQDWFAQTLADIVRTQAWMGFSWTRCSPPTITAVSTPNMPMRPSRISGTGACAGFLSECAKRLIKPTQTPSSFVKGRATLRASLPTDRCLMATRGHA